MSTEIQRRTVVTQWTYKTILGVFPSAAVRTAVINNDTAGAQINSAGGKTIIIDNIVAIPTAGSTPTVTIALVKSGVTPSGVLQDIVSSAATAANTPLIPFPADNAGQGLFTLGSGDALYLLCSAVTMNYLIYYRIEQ